VLGKYLESGALELQKGIDNGSIDVKHDIHLIKKDIMDTIANLVSKNTEDAVVIENEVIIADKKIEEEVDDLINDVIPDIELDLD
jgi:predicted TIM-barrel enzyme